MKRVVIGIGGWVVAGLVLALGTVMGCTPRRNALEPYRDDPVAAAELERRAAIECLARRVEIPANPFRTDGCTLWPDDGWVECCVTHDIRYWCGGSWADRHATDEAFRQCVSAVAGGGWARTMYWGVRIGGPTWMPFPWRWGYGWPWLEDP